MELWEDKPLKPTALSMTYIPLVSRSPRSRGWLRAIVPSEDTGLDPFNIEVISIYVVIVKCWHVTGMSHLLDSSESCWLLASELCHYKLTPGLSIIVSVVCASAVCQASLFMFHTGVVVCVCVAMVHR